MYQTIYSRPSNANVYQYVIHAILEVILKINYVHFKRCDGHSLCVCALSIRYFPVVSN